tara:strand:- start:1925 stop:2152 length:228 start_codon:yes stop_codon:yes gene_type:complete
MIDFMQKIAGEGKNNASMLFVLAASLYVGKLQMDQISAELSEVKEEQKQITKMLAEHATTWATIAERVKIYHSKE